MALTIALLMKDSGNGSGRSKPTNITTRVWSVSLQTP